MDLLYLTTELIVGFFALFVVVKLVGKTQLSQITPFDFISALVLGELLGNAVYDSEINLSFIIYALFLWAILHIAVENVGQKFIKVRGYTLGNPAIVIRNGMIDREQLKQNKININQLQTLLRQKDTFSVREVEYAILEPNGTLSVLKKSPYQTTERKDLNIKAKGVYLPFTIISDGTVLWDNLKECGFDKDWLDSQLSGNGIKSPGEVYYAEWLEGDGMYIVTYNEFNYTTTPLAKISDIVR
ncbi:MAG: YetF domain-containing protein [Bacillota bacterium]